MNFQNPIKIKQEKSVLYRKVFMLILLFAFFIRLLIGMGYFNSFDTYWYRNWAFASQNGIFDLYNNQEINLDYPPIYVLFLSVTGFFYKFVGNHEAHNYIQMLFMKFWPIFFDLLVGVALYCYFKRYNNKAALFASSIWLISPATIFNSAFWGQTDGLMCLLLLLSFWLLETKPYLAAIMFAISGLTKFQCLYFTPVFLYLLYKNYNLKTFFKGIAFAALTVFITFLPFMLATNRPLLFFEVYLNGGNSYPYCTLNAFNLYGIFALNWVEETTSILFGFNFMHLNIIMTALVFIFVLVVLIKAKTKCPYLASFLIIQGLFMLTTRMHERYQFVALIFMLIALTVYKKKEFFNLFVMLSIIITINQAVPMFNWQQPDSFLDANNYYIIMIVMSVINFIVFVYSVYICVKFMLKGENEICPSQKENENC